MVFIDLTIGILILTTFGIIVFDILDDWEKQKISGAEAGVFSFIFSVFAVIALLIVFL